MPPRLPIAALLCAALGLSGCGLLGSKAPNILLITLDTVRADRLGAYGYAAAQTPVLDELARRGVLFEAAFCQAPLTLPSHVSILTGTYPFFHGVRDNGYFLLSKRATTVAETLSNDAGYRTAAFISGYPLAARFGLNQGFGIYDDELTSGSEEHFGETVRVERLAAETTDRAAAWLEQLDQPPFFAWVHYFDPHSDYTPPEPFDQSFSDRPYDGEIAYVDRELGRLLEALRRLELEGSTIVAVIGDHGEGLDQHDETEHGLQVYDETIRIPLILTLPDGRWAGRRVEALVESIDLVPTLLELAGVEPARQVQGSSLVALLAGEVDQVHEQIYSETFSPRLGFGACELESLRSQQWKYVRAPRPELYDLERDPSELDNLHASQRQRAAEFDDRLTRLLTFRGGEALPGPVQTLDPEAQSKLASLGYLASSSGYREDVLSQPCEGDPKELVRWVSGLQYASRMVRMGQPAQARARLEQILARAPAASAQGENYRRMVEEFLAGLETHGS